MIGRRAQDHTKPIKRDKSVVSKPIGRDDSMPKSFMNVLREPIGDKKESIKENVGENSEIIHRKAFVEWYWLWLDISKILDQL